MIKTVNVIHVFGILNYGGAESMIMNLYRNIDHNTIRFDFIVHSSVPGNYDKEILASGSKIYHCIPLTFCNILKYVLWWINFFRLHPEYHIIHSHIRSSASIYFIIAKFFGVKTIIHSHSTSNGTNIYAVIKNILQLPLRYLADCMLACSNEAAIWLFGNKALESCILIRNSIDVLKFAPNEINRRNVRKILGIKNQFVYGHVGRYCEAKNHIFLIDVFNEIHKINNNSVLILIGDGMMKNQIYQKIIDLSLKESVIILGSRSDVSSLLQAFDMFLFPSKWEGFPISILEAQAAGIPCIISDQISNEVDITDLIHRVPIISITPWVELAMTKFNKNNDAFNKILNAGYDVHENAYLISRLYKQILKGKSDE